ncbi:hypothetical protein Tco_0348666 [Tanacetum coccineum]
MELGLLSDFRLPYPFYQSMRWESLLAMVLLKLLSTTIYHCTTMQWESLACPIPNPDTQDTSNSDLIDEVIVALQFNLPLHHYHHLYTYHHLLTVWTMLLSLSCHLARGYVCRLSRLLYEIGESSTARPIGGRGIDYGFVSTVDAEARRQGISEVGVIELAELHERDTHDLYALLEGDNMDCGGGGLCFSRGLGSLNRIESGDPSGALDPS